MYDKAYSELITIPNFIDRCRYLKLTNLVGQETFGRDRYLNQLLYHDTYWRNVIRPQIITRDNGCDLAHFDYRIPDGVLIFIHHINPITVEDILARNPMVFDPENLVTTIKTTHDIIHYGNPNDLMAVYQERKPNDTIPWR